MTQLDTARTLFPSVNTFSTYVVPATGHGINYRTSLIARERRRY